MVQRSPAASEHPELWVPVGVPSLITAQLDGLARAARKAGNRARLHLAVRHITDPAEARALAQLSPTDGDEYRLTVGSYLTNPRGAHYAAEIAAHSAALWLDVRALQAALFGVPASHLTTVDPIDEYVRRGLLSTDPRTAVDASVEPLLERVAALRDTLPRCPVGIRLAGEVCRRHRSSGGMLVTVRATAARSAHHQPWPRHHHCGEPDRRHRCARRADRDA